MHHFSNRPPRSQRVFEVRIGDARLKRIVFADSHHAAAVAARLQTFAPERIYPAVLLERERELWVEFIEGAPVERADDALIDALAALLCVLMKRSPRRIPLRETPWLANLDLDLAFLARVGVLAGAQAQRLSAIAHERAPAEVWLGYDCTDAILKNFVWAERGGLRAVDVESLGADVLLGTGAAKAAVRWLGERRGDFLARLRDLGAPDFEPYFDFVELSFRAFWQKSSFLEKKNRFVDPGVFAPFLGAR
ncbi:MAG TPA: hypothetical protein VKH41_04195 [Myxococcota bacterium]|nr:hypothetical protein [Myxococcota bacterium]